MKKRLPKTIAWPTAQSPSHPAGRDPARNMTPDGLGPTVGANCRGSVTADVLRDLIEVDAEVDMEDSGSGMSTQCLPRFGPSRWR
jgi:hypothetical protein